MQASEIKLLNMLLLVVEKDAMHAAPLLHQVIQKDSGIKTTTQKMNYEFRNHK